MLFSFKYNNARSIWTRLGQIFAYWYDYKTGARSLSLLTHSSCHLKDTISKLFYWLKLKIDSKVAYLGDNEDLRVHLK